MYKLIRKEKSGDRSRRRIATPSEQVVPTFIDGNVTVTVSKLSAAKSLVKRHGFTMVRDESAATRAESAPVAPPPIATPSPTKPTPAPKPEPAAGPFGDITNAGLRIHARDLDIKGRSSMDRDELIAAIVDAEAEE